MAKYKIEDIRNIAICGHGHSGKTTIVDHLLAKTSAVSGTPNVDDGTSVCDFDEEEKHHKYSIEASLVHFDHADKRFHVIDTPGYPDFIGQTIGALHGVETAAVVIDAHSGIQVNTRRVFAEAGKLGLGRLIIISKMGTENIDFPGLIDSIRELWGPACVLLNVPIGCGEDFKGVISTLKSPESAEGALMDPQAIHEALIESIVEIDETLMERYFEGQPPSDEELGGLVVRAVAAGSLIPIVCCSAKNDVGIAELLDALAASALPPGAIPRTAEKDGETIEIEPKADGPLCAQVFKTRIDPFVQKLSFIRVYSGCLKKDDHVHSSDSRKDVKIGPILQVMGEATEQIESAGPGDIVAIAKMDELHTGTSLGEYTLPRIGFPTPMVGLAVTPKTRGDETKLATALHKMVEEDPTFRIDHDQQTKEIVINGMSELHLGVVQERLKRRDHVEVDTKEPKIPFRETIQIKADGMYRHKKQSGGRGQFGEVHIRMQPLPRGTDIDEFATKSNFSSLKSFHYDENNNFLWVDSVVGGVIPGNFMPAIEKGFKERLARGVIAGYQIQDVCVEVHFGKHHPVDSSEAAFKTAGSMAFRNVFQQAKPSLLEPIARMEITVPDDNVGDVYSDLSTRGGRVSGSEAVGGGMQTVKAEVPLREVSNYNRTLSSMTGGQGSYTMEFDHYEVMPANVQQEIISKTKLEEEEDD
jgi:elongation factor G